MIEYLPTWEEILRLAPLTSMVLGITFAVWWLVMKTIDRILGLIKELRLIDRDRDD